MSDNWFDEDVILRGAMPDGGRWQVGVMTAKPGVMDEIAFRDYARRSGERVCDGDHENLQGACPACRASV